MAATSAKDVETAKKTAECVWVVEHRHAQKSMPSMRHQVAGRAETSLRLQERGVSKSHGGGEDEYRGLTRFGDALVCLTGR